MLNLEDKWCVYHVPLIEILQLSLVITHTPGPLVASNLLCWMEYGYICSKFESTSDYEKQPLISLGIR